MTASSRMVASLAVLALSMQSLLLPALAFPTTLTADVSKDFSDWIHSIAVADLDGDGGQDILCSCIQGSDQYRVGIFKHQPWGYNNAPDVFLNTTGQVWDIDVGDLNNDTRLDIVTTDLNNYAISVFYQKADKTFLMVPSITLKHTAYVRSSSIADLNGDGRMDLVSANEGEDTVSIYYQGASGLNATAHDLDVGNGPYCVESGLLNDDLIPDIVVAVCYDDMLAVYYGNLSAPNFLDPPVLIPTMSKPYNVKIGDLNSDGRADLAVANHDAGAILVLFGAVDGFSTKSQQTISGLTHPFYILLADLNSDGRTDLAVSDEGTGNITVYFQDHGALRIRCPIVLAGGNRPQELACADWDGDGKLDIMGSDSYYTDAKFNVYIQEDDWTAYLSLLNFSTITWSGTVNVNNTYTVEKNTTLVILPGTVVKFNFDSKIAVKGRLLANGTTDKRVYFLSLRPTPLFEGWGEIQFLQNKDLGDSWVQNSTMDSAKRGFRCDKGSSPRLINNIITNCSKWGIMTDFGASPLIIGNYITLSFICGMQIQGGSSPTLYNNQIVGNQGYGLYITECSSALIVENEISDNYVGIHLHHGSSAVMTNNTIENNVLAGIEASDSTGYATGNHISGSTYAFMSGFGSVLDWANNTVENVTRVFSYYDSDKPGSNESNPLLKTWGLQLGSSIFPTYDGMAAMSGQLVGDGEGLEGIALTITILGMAQAYIVNTTTDGGVYLSVILGDNVPTNSTPVMIQYSFQYSNRSYEGNVTVYFIEQNVPEEEPNDDTILLMVLLVAIAAVFIAAIIIYGRLKKRD